MRIGRVPSVSFWLVSSALLSPIFCRSSFWVCVWSGLYVFRSVLRFGNGILVALYG